MTETEHIEVRDTPQFKRWIEHQINSIKSVTDNLLS